MKGEERREKRGMRNNRGGRGGESGREVRGKGNGGIFSNLELSIRYDNNLITCNGIKETTIHVHLIIFMLFLPVSRKHRLHN